MIPEPPPEADFAIRRYGFADIEPIYQAVRESMAELAPWMPWCHRGYSREDSAAWVLSREDDWKADRTYDFVIYERAGGRLVGGVGLNHLSRAYRLANLGYWVRSSCTRRGAASAAARLVARFGFDYLDLERLEIIAAATNTASQRVAQKVGARREGLLRRRLPLGDHIHDAVLYSLIRTDLTS
ncbi:GNAT family N-acetyltransferase [Gloeobacter morelensis]|uniref:GNAT family N-acetyltransferase n=1 Tax=Gloeobacter morelensis MG652769 TaxID=2781736 RepID=A0ABY3PQ11_9CYAN|nr:GNAT family N-acetyltransferase [Gloeobacter morelensis]UFP95624.1 GNAT family N-acetyltransferase [Gloeobacter morelensis MG652769]